MEEKQSQLNIYFLHHIIHSVTFPTHSDKKHLAMKYKLKLFARIYALSSQNDIHKATSVLIKLCCTQATLTT